jgi:hypothetical protein
MRAERKGTKKGNRLENATVAGAFMPTAPTETQGNAPIAHRDVR